MIQSNLFKKHLLLSVVTIVLFLVLGFFAQHLIMRLTAPDQKQIMMQGPSIEFFAKLVDEIGLQKVEELNQDTLPFRFKLIDSSQTDLPPFAKAQPLKKYPNQSLLVEYKEGRGPRPPPGGERGPPRMGPGGPGGPGGAGGPPPLKMILVLGFVQVACVVLGAWFSISLFFRGIKAQALVADHVIAELQKGNLKARFPITKMDEIGRAMTRFNKMADEIEHLVDQMKQVEKSRVNLLQDLTHDLRTPIASLKNLLETIDSKKERIDANVLAEFMGLAIKEVDYFERLVEDLLVIAQMSEPKYHLDTSNVSLVDLLEEEIETVMGKSHFPGKSIELENLTGDDHVSYSGDAHLLKRMFRNAIENAHSFARTQTTIKLSKSESGMIVSIEDDGNGFSSQMLESFGVRKMTRAFNASPSGRLSVGLGSVIMKTVALLHRGSLTAKNRINANGKTEGAEVKIELPA